MRGRRESITACKMNEIEGLEPLFQGRVVVVVSRKCCLQGATRCIELSSADVGVRTLRQHPGGRTATEVFESLHFAR